MKTIKINLYSFNELSEEAQQKALEKYWTINVEHNWWESTYQDAENIGLKLHHFDLDRNRHATGSLMWPAKEVAESIIEQHGEACDTHKIAAKFLETINTTALEDGLDFSDDEAQFLDDLLEAYAKILQDECDYLQSKEAIIETFEANDYTFEASGKMNNTPSEQEA